MSPIISSSYIKRPCRADSNNTKELIPENGEPSAWWLVVNEFAHLVALPPMATTLSSLSGHVATVGELAQILHLS